MKKYLSAIMCAYLFLIGMFGIAWADFGQPGTILVAHTIGDGSNRISQINQNGDLLGRIDPSEGFTGWNMRVHLSLTNQYLFYSDPAQGTIRCYDKAGSLLHVIVPNSSNDPEIIQIVPDFENESIYLTDARGGTNLIRHLDNFETGQTSIFLTASYNSGGSVQDMFLGRWGENTALYSLCATHPSYGDYRLLQATADGGYNYIDSDSLIVSYTTDVGSVTVDPANGNVYVATGTQIIKFDSNGNSFGSFSHQDSKPSIDVDPSGNIYATGGSEGPVGCIHIISIILSASGTDILF